MKGFYQRIKKRWQVFFVIFLIFSFLPKNLPAETIGVIIPGEVHYYRETYNAFLSRLKREGYIERLKLVLQKPYPDYISLSNAARKLNALDVDLILTFGSSSTLAVIDTKTKTPIVYSCLSESFAQRLKGRNIIGINYKIFPSSLVRYLREIANIKKLGIIFSPNDPDSVIQMEDVRKAAEQYGIRAEPISLSDNRDVKKSLSGRNIDAIFITQSALVEMVFTQIIEFSRSKRMPTASLLPGFPGYYPTISLYVNERELGGKVAEMTIKILDGLPPELIKVSCCNEIELVFNLKEVKEMGYKIPMNLVATATKLIQ